MTDKADKNAKKKQDYSGQCWVEVGAIRQRFEVQLALKAVPIEWVEIPTHTRNELPPTLAALQWVFTIPQVSSEQSKLITTN